MPLGRRVLWHTAVPAELATAARSRQCQGWILARRQQCIRPEAQASGTQFRAEHNLALLFVVNLSPDQYRLLELIGLPEADVFEALSCIILYQDLLRSSLRVPTAKAPVECVIPCLPSAAGLERVLTGCAVHQMPEHLVPQLAEPGRRGPKPTDTAMDPAERQRKRRAVRRAQMEQENQRQREAAD